MAAPTPDSLFAWLERLHAAQLIKLSPRLVHDCARVLALRASWRREDLADSLASLLASDEETWRTVRKHFLERHEGVPRAPEAPPGPLDLRPVPGFIHSTPSRALPRWLLRRLPNWLRRPGRLGGLRWAAILFVIVTGGYLAGPAALRWAGELIFPPTPVDPAAITKLIDATPKPSPLRNYRHLESAPTRTAVETTAVAASEELPGPDWLRWLLLGLSPLLAMLAVRWWGAVAEFRGDIQAAAQRAASERKQAQRASKVVGVPYHIEHKLPFDATRADDAATILGRLLHGDPGTDLDVAPTIDRTIAAGGRIDPVFARSSRREVLVVLVDGEDGHPYLDGVELILERWRRGGLAFDRFDYSWEPSKLRRWPGGQPTDLDTLARRSEGRPLLVFSRMIRPHNIHRELGWLRRLEAWPVRAWVDLDPRTLGERAGEPALERVALTLRRFPWTGEGLVHCARFLAARGAGVRPPRELPLAPVRPEVLERWAACAALVPDPSWPQLDAVRRGLSELAREIRDPRQVQRLIEWARREGLAGDRRDYLLGTGDCLVLDPKRRLGLIAGLRAWDEQHFPRREDRLEYRARELLLRQLEAADTRGDEFGEQLRQVKQAFHRAAMHPEQAETLLREFADRPGARELKALVAEELALQGRGLFLGGAWGRGTSDTLAAFSTGAERARLRDFLRPRAWSWRVAAWAGLFGLLGVASGAAWWGEQSGLWDIFERPPEASVVATRVVETPTTWIIKSGPCDQAELTALAEVAPMCFVALPAGEFTMGSPADEPGRFDSENQHQARVGAFALGTHEVTLGQWKAVMGTSPNTCEGECDEKLPVVNVSWNDACRFMVELTRRENEALRKRGAPELTPCYEQTGDTWTWKDPACTGFRLPTETEWEYAARAGTQTAYSFGNDPKEMCKYGNGLDEARQRKYPDDADPKEAGSMFHCDDKFADLAPVGKFLPNAWRLHDMHGNAWEWVWDWYAGSYESNASTLGYTGPASGDMRVLRGGSFGNWPGGLRAAGRVWSPPTSQFPSCGLRCVRGAPQHLAD